MFYYVYMHRGERGAPFGEVPFPRRLIPLPPLLVWNNSDDNYEDKDEKGKKNNVKGYKYAANSNKNKNNNYNNNKNAKRNNLKKIVIALIFIIVKMKTIWKLFMYFL